MAGTVECPRGCEIAECRHTRAARKQKGITGLNVGAVKGTDPWATVEHDAAALDDSSSASPSTPTFEQMESKRQGGGRGGLWPFSTDALFIRDEGSRNMFTVQARASDTVATLVQAIKTALRNDKALSQGQRLWSGDKDLSLWPNQTLEALGVPSQSFIVVKAPL